MGRAITNIKCFLIGVGLIVAIAFSMNASAASYSKAGNATLIDSNTVEATTGGWAYIYSDHLSFSSGNSYTVTGNCSRDSGGWRLRIWDRDESFASVAIQDHSGTESFNVQITAPSSNLRVGCEFMTPIEVGSRLSIESLSVSDSSEEPTDPNAEVGVPLDLATFNQTTVDNQKIWTASFLACAFMLGVVAGRFR